MRAMVGLCTLDLHLPESLTLKDKRSVLKSMLQRLRQEHRVASAEIDLLDDPQMARIAFAAVSNSSQQLNEVLQLALRWIERNYPQVEVLSDQIEIL